LLVAVLEETKKLYWNILFKITSVRWQSRTH